MLHYSSLDCLKKIYLSIDEQMVPYFGRHSAKIFIRGKPIRFGYKNWILASSDGYSYKFGTYTGACKTKDSSNPLDPQVVSDLLSLVKKTCQSLCLFRQFFYIVLVNARFTRKRFQSSWDYTRKTHHEVSPKTLKIC